MPLPLRVQALAGAVLLSAGVFACSSSKTTTGTSGTGGTGGASTSIGAGGDSSAACAACLGQACAVPQAACDAECLSIQACIDAVCQHLSALASPDEAPCQIHCQTLHPTGKTAHLAYANCGISGAGCQPPCSGYDYDYKQCIAGVNAGSCMAAFAPCDTTNTMNAGNDCVTYQTCLGACTTLAGCLACAGTPGGATGEKQFESYQLCVAQSCFLQGWLPAI